MFILLPVNKYSRAVSRLVSSVCVMSQVSCVAMCWCCHSLSVLQCVAVCCCCRPLVSTNGVCVLQCVAMCYSALLCVAVCCSVLQCVAVCCCVLQRLAVSRSVLQCVAACGSVVQCVDTCVVCVCHVTGVDTRLEYIFTSRMHMSLGQERCRVLNESCHTYERVMSHI